MVAGCEGRDFAREEGGLKNSISRQRKMVANSKAEQAKSNPKNKNTNRGGLK